jgi:dTDP-4-amino-4,6-dideoxygalactose transaminase
MSNTGNQLAQCPAKFYAYWDLIFKRNGFIMNALKTTANLHISGDLTHTDNVINNTFWIGVQPALTEEMLEFTASTIETALEQ